LTREHDPESPLGEHWIPIELYRRVRGEATLGTHDSMSYELSNLEDISPQLVVTDGEPQTVKLSQELCPQARHQKGLQDLQRTAGSYLWEER